MYAVEYQQPKTVADAAALLAKTGGKALAGGQSLVAAMMNAVMDALASVGVKHFDMPASPHRVWSAIQSARHA